MKKLTTLQRIIIQSNITKFHEAEIEVKKQAKIRDATGKADAHEWYERSEAYELMKTTLEKLLPQNTEEYVL